MRLMVSSPAFANGERVQDRFTCEDEDVSPPLHIEGVPAGAAGLALLMDDPDAPRGLWTHWNVWDLPPTATEIPEGFQPQSVGAVEGRTSAGTTGWHGPCPPPGKPHRYFFRVFALDVRLGLPAGADRAALDHAMKGHVLAKGEFMGTYSR